jgi:hypothetical protein
LQFWGTRRHARILDRSTGLLLETIPAKHWPVLPWTEWDSRVDSTLEAGRLSLGGFVLSRFPQSHARFATFWCVLEALVLEEDLLISREYERFAAVNTRKISVNEVHSLPILVVESACSLCRLNLNDTFKISNGIQRMSSSRFVFSSHLVPPNPHQSRLQMLYAIHYRPSCAR